MPWQNSKGTWAATKSCGEEHLTLRSADFLLGKATDRLSIFCFFVKRRIKISFLSENKQSIIYHLVNWNIYVTKGKKINRDSVSSGERKRTRPFLTFCPSFKERTSSLFCRVAKMYFCNALKSKWCEKRWTLLEREAKEGDSPVSASRGKRQEKLRVGRSTNFAWI